MKQYLDLLEKVRFHGEPRDDRTGVGTVGLFGEKLTFDLREGFPLVTTKFINFRAVIEELLWMLRGETNVGTLNAKIWDEWANERGELGPIYGRQWRSWRGGNGDTVDQISQVINDLARDPYSRRHVVTAWNPAELPARGVKPHENPALGRMALAPCHCLFQFYVRGDYLDCQLYQRSADLFLGVPFNIASYALLTHMIAAAINKKPGTFHHVFGDVHLYKNHIPPATAAVVDEQLSRTPRELPQLNLKRIHADPSDYLAEDIELLRYRPWPAIKAPIAV